MVSIEGRMSYKYCGSTRKGWFCKNAWWFQMHGPDALHNCQITSIEASKNCKWLQWASGDLTQNPQMQMLLRRPARGSNRRTKNWNKSYKQATNIYPRVVLFRFQMFPVFFMHLNKKWFWQNNSVRSPWWLLHDCARTSWSQQCPRCCDLRDPKDIKG